MSTTRLLLVLFLVASCAGDKEVKPVEPATPEAPAELASPVAEEKEAPVEEGAPAEEGKAVDEAKVETYSVSITAVGKDLMTSLRVLREVSGLTVGEVKALMDGVPSEVKSGLTKAEAEEAMKKLSDAGFTATLAAAGTKAAASSDDDKHKHSVFLKDSGRSKIMTIKLVRSATKLSLKETKDLVESAPVEVQKGLSKADAQALVDSLNASGASAELR